MYRSRNGAWQTHLQKVTYKYEIMHNTKMLCPTTIGNDFGVHSKRRQWWRRFGVWLTDSTAHHMMMCQAQRVEPIEKKKQNNVHHLLIDGIGMERVSARRRCDPSPSNNASGAWCMYKRTYIVTSANEWKHRASAWKHDDNGGSHRSSNTKKKRIENSVGHSFAATCATKSKVKNTHHPHTPPSIVFHYFIDNEQTKKNPNRSNRIVCALGRRASLSACLIHSLPTPYNTQIVIRRTSTEANWHASIQYWPFTHTCPARRVCIYFLYLFFFLCSFNIFGCCFCCCCKLGRALRHKSA